MQKTVWCLSDLATELNVTLSEKNEGDGERIVSGMATLSAASDAHLTFLANPLYQAQLQGTKAGAVILHPSLASECPVPALLSDNPYLSYARASHLFSRRPLPAPGVHPRACVADDVVMGQGCRIGPNVVIEAGCVLGENVEVGAGTVIGAGSRIGNDCVLHANVTFYHEVNVGD